MIERFYLKNFLSFDEVELDLIKGLIVFTGPSGSGKSILMDSILSSLGVSSCDAAVCESSVTWNLNDFEDFIESDDINVFKHIKKEKSRYFINNQSLSKKNISSISSKYLRHLSLKDFSDFENENLLYMLDERIQNKTKDIDALRDRYQKSFIELQDVKTKLSEIETQEKKITELKEFATFEINKIEEVNPTIGEDEELLKIKKELSQKEKVLENIELAKGIFSSEHNVCDVLSSLDIESGFFDDAMNELRAVFDDTQERFATLEDIDVEEVLNRIEELSGLKRRYGSIEDALAYKDEKKKELEKYNNIEFEKNTLLESFDNLDKEMKKLAEDISKLRHAEIGAFCDELNSYLSELYLRDATVELNDIEYGKFGKDEMVIKLNATELQKISTGEFNRLRLAILALKSKYMKEDGGILILDEIDANLSGEESMSVAKVLKQLSKYFQIFVISHQPQLTSMGDQHYFVYKEDNSSFVKELDIENRVDEIARIISGENISDEAKKFARELLEVNG